MATGILSKAKAKEFKSLSQKRERDLRGLFMAEGGKCVEDMLGSFPLEILIATKNWIDSHPDIARRVGEKLFSADSKTLSMISSMKSLPEVIAVFHKPALADHGVRIDPGRLYLLLDDVQDPGNLGTIVRTCDWFGVYDIFASRGTADTFGPKVVQSTMGSLSRVRMHYVDLKELLVTNRDIPVIGTLLHGESIYKVKLPSSGFLLMGNEGKGISDDLKEYIDLPVTIPASDSLSHPDSLNVSIATAILLSEIKR